MVELQGVIDAIYDGSFFPDDQVLPHDVKSEPVACDGVVSVCSSQYEPSLADGDAQVDAHGPGLPALKGYDTDGIGPKGADIADDEDGGPGHAQVLDDGEDSDSSSSGSDALSSDHSDVAEPPARVKRFRARIPKEESWYVHSKSHLIHRFDGTRHNAMRFLVCGKLLTDAYALCTEATAWNTLCRSCNRR